MGKQAQFAALLAGVSAAAISTQAWAQQAQGEQAAAVEEVVVTGSRIVRTTFETPTPVTAISQQQLESKAATTVIELLRDIPALRPNQNTGGGRGIGISGFNMRSLGVQRTLVLLDGQRLMDSTPISPNYGFDLNVIPAPLVSRMDIVTAGASSVYGSDAVSGVVNVVLNDRLQGGRLDVQYNDTWRGDKARVSASAAYGTGFAGDRGRIVVALSYLDSPDLLYQGSRDWGATGRTLIPNPGYTATNGQFRQFMAEDGRLANMTTGGVITTAGALKNVTFGVNGEQGRLQQGQYVSAIWMQGGQGLQPQPQYGLIGVGVKQESLFSRALYDVTDTIEARLDILATRSTNESTNNFNFNNGDITIRRDNPYLPANILQAMVANNLQTVSMGRINPETGLNHNFTRNHYYRIGSGLKGKFANDWSWDLALNYTTALSENTGRNNRIQSRWALALDPVRAPDGRIVCRSTLTNPTNGCVPANVFGVGSLTQSVVDYVTGTSEQRSFSNSLNASANIAGELFATWAGPIQVAGGVEHRDDRVNNKSDSISNVNGWRQGTFASYRGKVKVSEIYGEASLPLARDLPLAEKLDLDVAARYVDYSTSGAAKVWKTGLNWMVNDQVRLRGTYSKDFRAPKLDDLFSASSLRQGNIVDFQGNRATLIEEVSGGNPNLKPEIAHTLTGGFILSPSFAPGLQVSVDYFDIELEGALTALGAQAVVDRCALGIGQFCQGIIRNAEGVITRVNSTQFNADTLQTSGVDFEVAYRTPLDRFVESWSGDLQLRTMATYTSELITDSGGRRLDAVGQLNGNGVPEWRWSATAIYTNGPFLFRALVNYIGERVYDNTYGPLDLDTQKVDAYTYVDLSAQYDLSERIQLYGKIENLFDKDPPPFANSTITIASAATGGFYDLLGRQYGIGVRYRW